MLCGVLSLNFSGGRAVLQGRVFYVQTTQVLRQSRDTDVEEV
jgi:hypothetical protein